MTTGDPRGIERRSADPDGELPLSAADLGVLASQLYAQLSGVVVGAPSLPDALASASIPEAAQQVREAGHPASADAVEAAYAAGEIARVQAGLPLPSELAAAIVPAGVPAVPVPAGTALPGASVPSAALPAAAATPPAAGAAPAASATGAPSGVPDGPVAAGRRLAATAHAAVPSVPTVEPAAWPGTAQSAQLADAIVRHGAVPALPAGDGALAVPGLPDLGSFASFAVPDLAQFTATYASAGTLPWRVVEPDLAPGDAASDYYRLGSPERSGGIGRHGLDDRSPEAGRRAGGHEVFDVTTLRRDFPILDERVNGYQLAWLDNAATTQKPQQVIDRLVHFYQHENSNIHRAAHELAARATDAYEEARETVRRFIGAPRHEDIIFARGTTEAINLVAQSWGGANLGPGDEILITHLEHHANIVPWQLLASRTGAVLKVAPVDDRGTLLLGEFQRLLSPRTKLVSATHVSNALGTVNPVHEIVELGHRAGARVLIDAAQSIPHIGIDVQRLGADFLVFSGHKVFGPTGIGVLYGTQEAFAETPVWQGGGNAIADVTLERAIFQGPPNKYEAGTGNIADAVGLGEALRYVERVGIERIAHHEHELLDYATERLRAVNGVRLVGTSPQKASVLSFVLAGHDPIEVGKGLNERGIAVRAGHHCAQPILRRLGLEATVRPSFAFYNTFDEADRLVEAVAWIAANPGR